MSVKRQTYILSEEETDSLWHILRVRRPGTPKKQPHLNVGGGTQGIPRSVRYPPFLGMAQGAKIDVFHV